MRFNTWLTLFKVYFCKEEVEFILLKQHFINNKYIAYFISITLILGTQKPLIVRLLRFAVHSHTPEWTIRIYGTNYGFLPSSHFWKLVQRTSVEAKIDSTNIGFVFFNKSY